MCFDIKLEDIYLYVNAARGVAKIGGIDTDARDVIRHGGRSEELPAISDCNGRQFNATMTYSQLLSLI